MGPKREQTPAASPASVANALSGPEVAQQLQALHQLSTTAFNQVNSVNAASDCLRRPKCCSIMVCNNVVGMLCVRRATLFAMHAG